MSTYKQMRMDFIMCMLRHYGQVSRVELCDMFGISEPQATRDFKDFDKENPLCAMYCQHSKKWVRGASFHLQQKEG